MAKFNSGNLFFTSGETVKLTLSIYKDGVAYTLQDEDTLTFTARKCYKGDIVIEKTSVGTNEIVLSTAYTTIDPGEYLYDVWLRTADGEEWPVIGAQSIKSQKKNLFVYVRAAE